MRVELLSVPDCPNVGEARRVVADCLTELGLTTTVVERVGNYRSPTVLVNGVDVMGAADDELAGGACRLDLPTRDRMRAALSTVDPLTIDALFDGERDGTAARAAALPAAVREVHRAVLNAFLTSGGAPHEDRLRHEVGTTAWDASLARLTRADLVHIGPDGHVVAAYPFSGRPTGHTVRLTNRVRVEAMCAIDALGIPLMTDQDTVITSTDPASGHAIRVERTGGVWRWTPTTSVVVIAQKPRCGPAATCLCPTITFHTTASAAGSHLRRHPELRGVVLTQDDAIDIAGRCFGSLLTD